MRRIILFLIAVPFFVIPCHAQMTLTPVKAECSKKCSGSFTLINQGLTPTNFSIDIFTTHFSQATQGPVMSPLTNAEVKVSQTSGRISPHEARQIDYHVQCTVVPCVVSFISSFSSGHTKVGQAAVRTAVMFSAYSCIDAKDCRLRTLQKAKVVPPENRPNK